MKKVIFAIAISALFLASCGTGSTPAENTTVDSTAVVVDTTLSVDTTACCGDTIKK
jgi:hypothetical protein